jgi:hypothetical protein
MQQFGGLGRRPLSKVMRIDQGHAMAPYRCIQCHGQTRGAASDDQQIKGATLLQGSQQISPTGCLRYASTVSMAALVSSAIVWLCT